MTNVNAGRFPNARSAYLKRADLTKTSLAVSRKNKQHACRGRTENGVHE